MRNRSRRSGALARLVALAAALALAATACSGGGEGGPITVGSADFDESEIVANMYAAVLEEEGYEVERRMLFGNREAYFGALESGELDLVPEYLGSAIAFLTSGEETPSANRAEAQQHLQRLVEDSGLRVLMPAEAQNANGYVVTRETADEHNLRRISDLAPVAGEMVLGGPPECPERPLCLIGLQEVYGLEFADFQPLDAGGPVTVEALANGDIDVAVLFTTDQSISANDWVLLEDDQGLQPAENIAPVIREEVLDDTIRARLMAISQELTTEELTELNRRVRFDGEDPQMVAEDWLIEHELLNPRS